MSTDASGTNYIALASVDYYDGDAWTFTRTYRPSGGVIPAEIDPSLRAGSTTVDQQYTMHSGPLTSSPWMPYLERAQQVDGIAIDTDADTGMPVPTAGLDAGTAYSVRSTVPTTTFAQLPRSAQPATSAPPIDTALANGLALPLSTLISSLATETGASSDTPLPFLQAVAADLRKTDALAGAAGSATGAQSSSGHAGGTSFADVLASIRADHSATPEQYATLTALVARRLGVPARVVAGFRIPLPPDQTQLPAGTYTVTTAQAWTWVEIPVQSYGWVVLDPSPGTYANAPTAPGATPTPTPTPTASGNAQLIQSKGGHAVAPRSRVPSAGGLTGVEIAAIVVFATLLVIGMLAGLHPALRLLRARRRRQVGDPRERLIGAWQETLDVLEESGLPDLSSLTSREVVSATVARFGGVTATHTLLVAEAADEAVYRPSSFVGNDAAEQAWQRHVRISREVRRQLSWRTRATTGLRYRRPPRH
jgi:transglutaminase-like putative cysteine protease